MDRLFEGNRNTQDDYYSILGCCETSSTEQILAEYKVKALKYHPDKNLNDPSIKEKFLNLQKAKETLTIPAKRRDYDIWKNSGLTISYQNWVSMRGQSTSVFHWATTTRSQGKMLQSGLDASSKSSQDPSDFPEESVKNIGYLRDNIISKFRNYEI